MYCLGLLENKITKKFNLGHKITVSISFLFTIKLGLGQDGKRKKPRK